MDFNFLEPEVIGALVIGAVIIALLFIEYRRKRQFNTSIRPTPAQPSSSQTKQAAEIAAHLTEDEPNIQKTTDIRLLREKRLARVEHALTTTQRMPNESKEGTPSRKPEPQQQLPSSTKVVQAQKMTSSVPATSLLTSSTNDKSQKPTPGIVHSPVVITPRSSIQRVQIVPFDTITQVFTRLMTHANLHCDRS